MDMTQTMTPPQQPDRLRQLIAEHNTAVQMRVSTVLTPDGSEAYAAAHELYQETVAAYNAYLRSPEGLAYRAEVERYNAWVMQQRTARAVTVQAARNRREVTKVRSAACPTCFATHAGEC